MSNPQAVANYGLNVPPYPGPTHARVIRDAAIDRLSGITFDGAAFTSIRRVPVTTVQSTQLPALGVYIVSCKERQDGARCVSYPQFIVALDLGISMACMSGSDDLLDSAIDIWVNAAKQALFCDHEFMELFEFVTGTSEERIFTKDGQSYVGESRFRLSLEYRTAYPPFAPYDLLEIDIKVVEPDETPQIEEKIKIAPNIPGQPNLR